MCVGVVDVVVIVAIVIVAVRLRNHGIECDICVVVHTLVVRSRHRSWLCDRDIEVGRATATWELVARSRRSVRLRQCTECWLAWKPSPPLKLNPFNS